MLFAKRSLGIDWDGDTLTIVALARRLGRVAVLDWLSLTAPQGEEARQRVGEFLDRNRLREARVTACLPRDDVVVRFLAVPVEAERQLANVVAYQVDALHPFPPGAVYWDHAIVSRGLKQLQVMVVIVEKQRLQACDGALVDLGLSADSVTLQAACLVPLVAPVLPEGAVVVLGRRQGVELVGFHHGKLCATRELLAENDVTQRWERELHSLQALLPMGEPAAVPLFVVGQLPEAFAGMLAGAPSLPALAVRFECPPSFRPEEHLGALAAACAGLERRPPVALNLLPSSQRRRPADRWTRVPTYTLGTTAALLLLAVVGDGWIADELYARALKREIERLEPRATAAREQNQRAQQLAERAAWLEAERDRTWRQLGLLQELTRLLPDGTWLQEVQVGEETAEVFGYSDRAAELVQNLESSPLFAQVELASPITRDVQGKEIFRMRMRLEPPPAR